MITKCFHSDDASFVNHDVCVFFTENGFLHVTADIYNGFLHADRDLGCYEFSLEEIELVSVENSNGAAVALRIDEREFFILGKSAGDLIKRKKREVK